VPTFLLEAWVAQRRQDGTATADAYARALELAERVGFGDHAAFALVGLGTHALAEGDLGKAEELERQALETASAAHAASIAAYARNVLAQIAAASGDGSGARQLYQQVLEWSRTERRHEARESLFLALAGDPAAAAERGLAELGETALT
jgi:tetratricopeptide (TPR) repeat protein